jgi:hypothetical protein
MALFDIGFLYRRADLYCHVRDRNGDPCAISENACMLDAWRDGIEIMGDF